MKSLNQLFISALIVMGITLFMSWAQTQERKLEIADTLIQAQSEVISHYQAAYGATEYQNDFLAVYTRKWQNREPNWHPKASIIMVLAGLAVSLGWKWLRNRREADGEGSSGHKSGAR